MNCLLVLRRLACRGHERWVSSSLRGSNSKKKIFVCFNAMQFIIGQVLGHGTTNIKISFSKLP